MPVLDETPAVDSPALVTALKAFASLTREQKSMLSQVLEGFVESLHSPTAERPNPCASEVITEKAWHNRANWGDDQWKAWTTWVLYKHFCRTVSASPSRTSSLASVFFSHAPRVSTRQYSPYLRNYSVSLSTVVFAKIDGATDDAAVLMKNLWNVATGQE